MGRLDGKVAFITGAGGGIARATAKAFAREGAGVAIIARREENGRTAEQEIRDGGGKALFVKTDVTQDEQVKAAVEETVGYFGSLNVLVSCAGGSLLEDAPVHEMDPDIWHRTMALNLLHPFLVCRYGVPHLIEGGGGSIINYSSFLGMTGYNKPAYAASKGGVVAFTRTLAAQYVHKGIRANCISPGSITTERTANRYSDRPLTDVEKATINAPAREAFKHIYPMAWGVPEDMTGLAVFLASDESRMITGVTIPADGGRTSYIGSWVPGQSDG